MQNEGSLGFDCLPLELRRMVWSYVAPRSDTHDFCPSKHQDLVALLLVNKQWFHELSCLLFQTLHGQSYTMRVLRRCSIERFESTYAQYVQCIDMSHANWMNTMVCNYNSWPALKYLHIKNNVDLNWFVEILTPQLQRIVLSDTHGAGIDYDNTNINNNNEYNLNDESLLWTLENSQVELNDTLIIDYASKTAVILDFYKDIMIPNINLYTFRIGKGNDIGDYIDDLRLSSLSKLRVKKLVHTGKWALKSYDEKIAANFFKNLEIYRQRQVMVDVFNEDAFQDDDNNNYEYDENSSIIYSRYIVNMPHAKLLGLEFDDKTFFDFVKVSNTFNTNWINLNELRLNIAFTADNYEEYKSSICGLSKHCPQLEKLKLTMEPKVNNVFDISSFYQYPNDILLTGFYNLRSIVLSTHPAYGTKQLMKIAKDCRSLNFLKFEGDIYIDMRKLIILANSESEDFVMFPCLEYLDCDGWDWSVESTQKEVDTFFGFAVKHFPYLSEADLL